MNQLLPLMRREWLQHRFAWALLLLLPLALATLLLSVANVQIGDASVDSGELPPPALIAFMAFLAGTSVSFLIVWVTSLFIATGIARRDHADRSIEFWLSLPVSHSASLATPLMVHLLLVPAAALLLGTIGGTLISAVLMTRIDGFAGWLALPWHQLLPAALAIALRLLVGLPLATLWLLPLILLAVLARAYIGRWGVPVLVLALGLGSLLLQNFFGQPLLATALVELVTNALAALIHTTGLHFDSDGEVQVTAALGEVPGWAWGGFLEALRELATPPFVAAMLFSGACFWLLVQWRGRGASGGGD